MNYNFETEKELEYVKDKFISFKNDRGAETVVVNTGSTTVASNLAVLLLSICLFGEQNIIPVSIFYSMDDCKNRVPSSVSSVLEKFNIKNNIVNIHDSVNNIIDMIGLNIPGGFSTVQTASLQDDMASVVLRAIARMTNGIIVDGFNLSDSALSRVPLTADFYPFKSLTVTETRSIGALLLKALDIENKFNSFFMQDSRSICGEDYNDEDIDDFIRFGKGSSFFARLASVKKTGNSSLNGPNGTLFSYPNHLLN